MRIGAVGLCRTDYHTMRGERRVAEAKSLNYLLSVAQVGSNFAIITQTYRLDEIDRGYADLEAGKNLCRGSQIIRR